MADLTAKQVPNEDVTPYEELRASCAYSLAHFSNTIDEAGEYLTDGDVATLTEAGRNFLITYSALARQNLDWDICLYGMKPKFHQLDHQISDLATDRLNPKIDWNYGDEDIVFVVLFSRLALSNSGVCDVRVCEPDACVPYSGNA